MDSNLGTAQITQESHNQAIDDYIRKATQEAGQPIPKPNCVISPDMAKRLQEQGYVKDGELTRKGEKFLFGI
jgi:hypothetical protein